MKRILLTALGFSLLTVFAAAQEPAPTRAIAASSCITKAAPGGSILPPIDCGYITPAKVHQLLKDPNTPDSVRLELEINHRRFLCLKPRLNGPCKIAKGGPLGGQLEHFDSTLVIDITGTGDFADYKRTLALDAYTITATSELDPNAETQTIANEMVAIEAVLKDDVDFSYLRIVAGTANGLESRGETTITRVGDGTWEIDSFFDIQYQIEVEADPKGALAGFSSSGKGHVTMQSVAGDR